MAADDRAEFLPVRPRESDLTRRMPRAIRSPDVPFAGAETHLRIASSSLESMKAAAVQKKPVENRLITR
jgi:hypothetical protein